MNYVKLFPHLNGKFEYSLKYFANKSRIINTDAIITILILLTSRKYKVCQRIVSISLKNKKRTFQRAKNYGFETLCVNAKVSV